MATRPQTLNVSRRRLPGRRDAISPDGGGHQPAAPAGRVTGRRRGILLALRVSRPHLCIRCGIRLTELAHNIVWLKNKSIVAGYTAIST